MGTLGGNLCQRNRCWYFRDEHVKCLLKGGRRCYAIDGENQYHAIFTKGHPCVIVHPSTLAPALIALGATAEVQGPKGKRTIELAKFFQAPVKETQREHVQQALTNVESTQAQIASLQSAAAQTTHALAVLLGKPPAELNAEFATAAPIPEAPLDIAVGVPADTLRLLFRSGLLSSSSDSAPVEEDARGISPGTTVALYGALHNTVAAHLRDEPQLRERLVALASDLNAAIDRGSGIYLLILRRLRFDNLPGGIIPIRKKVISAIRDGVLEQLKWEQGP